MLLSLSSCAHVEKKNKTSIAWQRMDPYQTGDGLYCILKFIMLDCILIQTPAGLYDIAKIAKL